MDLSMRSSIVLPLPPLRLTVMAKVHSTVAQLLNALSDGHDKARFALLALSYP